VAIYLIRHGQTGGNAARVFQRPDAPLSGEGMRQAERLARRLAGAGITRIWSSDYARAVATAERLREATGADLTVDPLLRERNFGALRGIAYAALRVDPFAPDFVPPEGESWEDLHVRVDAAWERLRGEAAGGAHLAVVTHGLVCHALVSRHWLLPPAERAPLRFDNTALTIAEAGPPHRVRLLNCTAHLETVTEGGAA
jgi:broad specificity phosphatase PhoE